MAFKRLFDSFGQRTNARNTSTTTSSTNHQQNDPPPPPKIPDLDPAPAARGSTIRLPDGATTLSKQELKSRILGLLFGQAIGDALGLATEFRSKEQAKAVYGEGPIRFGLDTSGVPIDRNGHVSRFAEYAWTDDTDQALQILDSIFFSFLPIPSIPDSGAAPDGLIDHMDFARRLKTWAKYGIPELNKPARGIGMTVGSVLNAKEYDADPWEAARKVQAVYKNNLASNGAVMRTSLATLPNFWHPPTVAANATRLCTVTHADDRCIASCRIATAVLSSILCGTLRTVEDLTECLTSLHRDIAPQVRDAKDLETYMFATSLDQLELSEPSSIGYTYKCLASGLVSLRTAMTLLASSPSSPEEVVRDVLTKLTLEGGDADTNGAVAGALVGCFVSVEGLPDAW
ncbi:hypothetical protein HK104_010782, partial [Borealophlyctis nickersoniae]